MQMSGKRGAASPSNMLAEHILSSLGNAEPISLAWILAG